VRAPPRDSGLAILVRGPAGIGKTALVDEAVRQAGPARRVLRTVIFPKLGIASRAQLTAMSLDLSAVPPQHPAD
jgi:hypothetical protein